MMRTQLNGSEVRQIEKKKRLDPLSPAERSERMSRVRCKDTKPELRIRKMIHGLGYRFRLHRSNLPGKPDVVFPRKKKVLFIHGCFWHRHDCSAGRRMPKSRKTFWRDKLNGNKRRDQLNQKLLRERGWDVMVIWECEVKSGSQLENRIHEFLKDQ